MWAGSGGNICMAAGEWLRPERGGAHESSRKALGTRRVASGEPSVGGVLAVRFHFGEAEAQERSDAGFSHTATVSELPSWPGSRLRNPERWNPAARSLQTCTLLSPLPQPQISNTASPCRPHPAWTGGETSSRLGLGTRPPSPGSGPSSVRNLSLPKLFPSAPYPYPGGGGSHQLLIASHTQAPSPICLDPYLCVPWAVFICSEFYRREKWKK